MLLHAEMPQERYEDVSDRELVEMEQAMRYISMS